MAAQKKKKSTNGITKDQCRMITPEFRVSFPHLFKAQAMGGATPKFSITMLFPKTKDITGSTVDGEEVSLKTIIRNAKIAEFGAKENWPDEIASPVVDGDLPKNDDKDGYKGNWVIKATSNQETKPGLVDEDMNPITDQALFYPGCYARAYIFARVWEFPENSGKYGVQLIVDHVQKLRDGKAFGGKKPVEQVFKPVGTGRKNVEEESEEEIDEENF